MFTFRPLDRPDFEADAIDFGFHHEYLNPALKESLSKELPSHLTMHQRQDFLSYVRDQLQLLDLARVNDVAVRRDQLNNLALCARKLLQSLDKLSFQTRAELRGSCVDLSVARHPPPIRLSELGEAMAHRSKAELLGHFWDTVQDLEIGSEYAVAQCKPSKQDRLSITIARQLTEEVAGRYYRVFGRLPPCSKDTWFPAFMATLGAAAKFPMGVALVAGVVTRMRKTGEFPHTVSTQSPD